MEGGVAIRWGRRLAGNKKDAPGSHETIRIKRKKQSIYQWGEEIGPKIKGTALSRERRILKSFTR